METKLFKSGDKAPVSGNYRFLRHEPAVATCCPRFGAYLHLRKGSKIPLHDDCLQPAVYKLMTITEEEKDVDPKTRATA